MKKTCFLLLLAAQLLCFGTGQAQSLGNAAELPFELELEDATQDELPGLHSCAFGRWGEWWVAIGGRIGGLHGFFAVTGFPEDEANIKIRLLNPETGAEITYEVENLSGIFIDPLKSTNPQYVQDGSHLYIIGGYGKDLLQNKFVTFSTLTSVDLPLLVSKMTAGQDPSTAFHQIESEHFQVCGGEMEKMGDWFYLVGGHNFSGLYSDNGIPTFTQEYTNEIRKFKISLSPNNVPLFSDYSAFENTQQLHRRDFSMAPLVRPDGSEALALYGGVFQYTQNLPFYNPIYITGSQIFSLDASFQQQFSQYTCPVVPMYNATDSSMYSIFFAGLSTHYRDAATGLVAYDDKVPFIRDITTVRRRADGSSTEYLLPQHFDELLGTNMIFMPVEEAPHYANEVIRLHELQGRTFVGWLFGGIRADIPNFTPSIASKRLFKVYITPQTNAVAEPAEGLKVSFSPNPFGPSLRIRAENAGQGQRITLYNSEGKPVFEADNIYPDTWQQLERHCTALESGIYFCTIHSAEGIQVYKLVHIK
ncbi:MAG: T9SS type A sorting domain-containing protein [Saprospiraceae bacterium]|nr:T9SS type A sorting domain-containing protein [Saprospiraceae bacterium]